MTRSEIRDELTKELDVIARLRATLGASNQASEDRIFEDAIRAALEEARSLARRFANTTLE